MIYHRLTDYSDAYANGKHIVGGDRWPAAWVQPAADYRTALDRAGRAKLGLAYGAHARQRFDLFLPEDRPRGLVVFIHGGYWMSLDNSYWSHLAAGSVESGFAVAMPSYVICPEARIADITRQIAAAITAAAAMVDGPLAITGHSAGGHLAARMVTETTPLVGDVLARVATVVPISGLHDLRPLMATAMNETLGIDAAEAEAESPALLRPVAGARVGLWVGGAERPEFVRQSALLANVWLGVGAETAFHADPNRHHFDVIDGLADPRHPLTRTLLAPR
jgi:acetyl esterase/lipase